MMHGSLTSVTDATCRRDEETKKTKDTENKEINRTMANWLFAETTQVVGSKCPPCRMVSGLWELAINCKFHE